MTLNVIYQQGLKTKACLEGEITQLKAENADLQAENENLTEEKNRLQTELDSMPTECEVLLSNVVTIQDLDDVDVFEGADISQCLEPKERLMDLDNESVVQS